MTATCSNCPYGKQSEGLRCHRERPGIEGGPRVSAGGLCGHHPFHPARVHELAAMAMQGLLKNQSLLLLGPPALAAFSYDQARALLAEAEKEGGER